MCGVSQSVRRAGADGAGGRRAAVGDPQIHCNEWRTDRPAAAAAAGKYLCLHYLNKRSGGSDREDDDGGGGGEEEEE